MRSHGCQPLHYHSRRFPEVFGGTKQLASSMAILFLSRVDVYILRTHIIIIIMILIIMSISTSHQAQKNGRPLPIEKFREDMQQLDQQVTSTALLDS
jgi:hypothetical protein